jgi:Ceramidase
LKNSAYTFSIPQLLLSITLITFVIVFIFIKPIPQNIDYHHFANDKTIFGIANAWNVLSNIGFIIIGLVGISFTRQHNINNPIVWVLFAGIILTGIGSAYYHYNPNNTTLVWDRLPMTIVFTSFFALIYAWCFNEKMGFKIWLVSLANGIYAVFYWQYTEQEFRGDLRLYAIIQFLPIVLIVIILSSRFKSHSFLVKPIAMIIVWYIIAKFLEHYDNSIFEKTNIISGHPIKHIAAAMATFYIYKMVKMQLTKGRESLSVQ